MKNVLITGANGGMGKATCELLSALGYRVFGLDKSAPTSFSGERFFQVDLASEDALLSVCDELKQEVDELFAIIHMAGIYDLNSLIEMREEDVMRIFQANLFSVYRVNRILFPLLASGSRIVITTSELAPLDPLPFTGIYGITKSALEKYAFSLRMELALHKISVSILRPGAVKTGLLGDSTAALDRFVASTELYQCNAERFKRIVDSVETKNVPPKKVARLALRALKQRRPKYVYNLNRNALLRILSSLPDRLQVFIISKILQKKKEKPPR